MCDLFASELIQEHPGYQGRSSGNDTCLFLGEFTRLAGWVRAAVTTAGVVAEAVHGDPQEEEALLNLASRV
jgi:hypothetical protein